jgi:hypothetical protein
MALILGLLIFCLGLYFLSLFFQVARLEKVMSESVTLLEKYMMVKYSLGNDAKKKSEAGSAGPEAPASGGITSPPLATPPGPR